MGSRRYGGGMIELARRRMMMGGSAKPYDAEVEYLQVNGHQYIDTGIIPNHTNEFDVDLTYIGSNEQNQAIIGARNANQQATSWSNMSLSIWLGTNAEYAANDKNIDSGALGRLTVNNRYILSIRNRKFYLDSVQKWSSGQSENYNYTNTTIGLLHSHGTNNFWDTRRGHNLKLHSVKIYSYAQLVRDYIPVRVGNTGYLYDRVSGQLFGNAGTGQFTIGPDK